MSRGGKNKTMNYDYLGKFVNRIQYKGDLWVRVGTLTHKQNGCTNDCGVESFPHP